MRAPSKKNHWFPLILTLLVLPGMGHLYLGKKFKGYLFGGLSIFIVMAAFARYMSVLFALANIRRAPRPPKFDPLGLMAEAWRLDFPVLIGFLLAFLLVWGVAALDLGIFLKEGRKT